MDDQLLQTIIIGLSNGLIYALVALGYTLVYGILELINFAHGDVFMLGSMIALTLLGAFGVVPGLPLLNTIGADLRRAGRHDGDHGPLNVSIERIAYRPLRNAPKLAPLISAIGVSFILQNIGLLWKGPASIGYRTVIPSTNILTSVFGLDTTVVFTFKQFFVGIITIPLLLALIGSSVALARARPCARPPRIPTPPGYGHRRQPDDRHHLRHRRCARRGRRLGQILYNNTTVWNLGFRFGLNAFTAAVLGGIGNLQGAVLGGIVLGLINAFSDRYLAAPWTNAIVFGVLIAVLVFRPTGLLGEQVADRA